MDYSFRKILVALDASENALRAVDYVGEITGGTPGFHVMLLHIVRFPSRDHFPSDDEWQKGCDSAEKNGKRILADGVERLKGLGVNESSISIHMVRAGGVSIAAEIMQVQKDEGFGTVVVGRRGVSKAEEFLFGSVSNKVVHYSRNCTVWVVE
jgi:nucleotide-binding universal stress UspA family protein